MYPRQLVSASAHHLHRNAGSTNSVHGQQHRSPLPPRHKTKEDMFREFCERAGRRYNPKEIYFIDMSDAGLGSDDHDGRYSDEPAHKAHTHQHNQLLSDKSQRSQHHNYNLYASNSSLHKSYPKSLFELEQRAGIRGIQNNIRTKVPQTDSGGGVKRSQCESGEQPFSSQTLPRNFLKHNADMTGSASALSGQYHQQHGGHRLSNGNIQQQQQQQQQRLAGVDIEEPAIRWPMAIPVSPSSFSTRSQFYARGQSVAASQRYSAMNGGGGGSGVRYGRRSPDGEFGTFDLDRMETDRRKSHASLFEADMDYENGTAV